MSTNVLGEDLVPCNASLRTGFFRDGTCQTGGGDVGVHAVCAEVTAEFLEFSKARGNDLTTPNPQWKFPGLAPGDRWCICAPRWQEALDAGFAPPVVLASTHVMALEFLELKDLIEHAIDPPAKKADS